MRPLIFAFAVSALAFAAPAMAQVAPMPHPGIVAIEGALLTVIAEGDVEGAPDIAYLNLGVATEGQSAQAAMQANAQRMNALVAALRRAGIAERDIQTANLSVNPQYVYGDGVPPRITGYQASNNVNARVRNLDTLGRVVDAAVNAGGNTVNGISFALNDPEPRLNEARREAVSLARERATLYAQAAGLRVHRIVSISEGYGMTPPIPMPMMRMEAMDARAAPPPVQPGEVRTSASVTVVFELR